MNKFLQNKRNNYCIAVKHINFLLAVGCACFFCMPAFHAQDNSSLGKAEDAKLVEKFIKAKGYNDAIIFDASNVKQFWIDKTIASKNGSIHLVLEKKDGAQEWESVPLKVKLINVNELQDCNVTVFSKVKGNAFVVTDSESDLLSASHSEDDFVQYHIESAIFHLIDTPDNAFNLQFFSKNNDMISIYKIAFMFFDNKDYEKNPLQIQKISDEDVKVSTATNVNHGENGFTVSGKQNRIYSKNKIQYSDRALRTSVKVKNIGKNETRISLGYDMFSQDGTRITPSNYPFNNTTKVLTVISAKAGSSTIIVDSVPDWAKGCYIALNAKDDLSDVPNTSLLDGKVQEVKEMSDNQAMITLSSPLKNTLDKGTKIRIHNQSANPFYSKTIALRPGEEHVFSTKTEWNNPPHQYSSTALSKDVSVVIPLLFSYSLDPNEENQILISDYKLFH